MGYSSRYHVASLVAVFIALAIGILIGAALGSDVVSGTAENLESDLGQDLNEVRAENADLRAELETERSFSAQLIPAVVSGRLAGREIALVVFGTADTQALSSDLEAALSETGANLTEVAAVREPPETQALVEALVPRRERAGNRFDQLEEAARRAGRRLAGRGALGDVRTTLLARSSGSAEGIDGVVVARLRPELEPREERETERLEVGLVRGLLDTGARVVGAERTDTDPSSIEFLAGLGLPTVDNIDMGSGRVALSLVLDDSEGNFGVKDTADALLPDLIEPTAGGSAR